MYFTISISIQSDIPYISFDKSPAESYDRWHIFKQAYYRLW
jgi:hypothetical protein